MKKSSLVVLLMTISLGISACGVEDGRIPEAIEVDESNDIVSDDLPDVIEVASETEESEEELREECTFTKDKANKVKEYFEGYNYINIVQSMENGLKDDDAYTKVTYNVIADTSTKVVDFDIITSFNDGEKHGDGGVHYIRDYINDITYQRDDSDTRWNKCDGEILMIDWDFMSYENAYDIWQYLMKDNDTPVDTVGYVSGEYEYYTVTTKANDSFITGLEYDKLGDQESTYIYHNIGGTLIPTSVVIEINYFIGDKEYFVRSTIQLGTVGNTSLNMPELDEE